MMIKKHPWCIKDLFNVKMLNLYILKGLSFRILHRKHIKNKKKKILVQKVEPEVVLIGYNNDLRDCAQNTFPFNAFKPFAFVHYL